MPEIIKIPSLLNPSSCVAYYRLENVNDSKNSYTLTNNNTVAFAAGKFFNCADFSTDNPTNQRSLTSTGITTIDLSINNSISYWMKVQTEPTGAVDYRTIVWLSNSGTSRYVRVHYLLVGGNKTLRATFGDTNIDYTVTLGTTSWHHIVTTVDGSGNTALYVDGVSRGTSTMGAGTGGSNTLAIGGQAGVYASVFIDDVALFSKCLNAQEVLSIYAGGNLLDSEL